MSANAHTNGAPHPQHPSDVQPEQPPIAPTEFIPPPPPKPFSSEDSTDAIALRAAISSLQLQKKKAQDDIRTLEKARKQAVQEPERFREELAAGRVQERKMTGGDLRAILDADSDDDEEGEGGEREDEDMPDADAKKPFLQIPGPQNVVRMPHVNWEKYHIVGEPLDRMHEQQRKWPGSSAYGSSERGREFAVAAPYSPWLDPLESRGAEGEERKDSAGGGVVGMNGGSEHPMETRRGGVRK